jgi:hypothetical protein
MHWPEASARSSHGITPNFNGPDEYLFVYNLLNLSDLLLKLSSRLFDVAFCFEFRIACHFACRRMAPFTSCAVPLSSSLVPVFILFSLFCDYWYGLTFLL